jgi:hypothetical protein
MGQMWRSIAIVFGVAGREVNVLPVCDETNVSQLLPKMSKIYFGALGDYRCGT